MSFFTQLLNGLQLGSIYALVALGYTMVYGIILLLNFAHGDIIMAGAYISWIAMAQLGMHPALAALLSIVGCMALGVAIDKIAYAPLREAPRLSVLITAIGVSYFLESGSQLIFGADAKVVPSFVNLTTVSFGAVTLSLTAILTVAITCISTIVLTFLVQKTRLGKAMRAVSEDMGAARLMGVNVNSTISFTFAVGSALAGIGAILYSMAYHQATPTMGIMLGTKAFVAAVLGGIGSIPGAVVGGLVVGFVEVSVAALGLSVWQDAVVFLLLIVVLVVKPTGLLGHAVTEKV
ncbi:inner-membrane translocator [Lancefieldella rimae]|uniref:Branched-chain amino acid ABC transporter, permease protein n=3 Tax=Lancefieldella rimae TaxID=1383 RepID=B9CKP3_LANR4|nr:branched-chain amino acid ABC transporter permease [Lancefieldella rimae]EEE17923.1 branched-chain amino acid ABC transporter, permease protein [Lancefieldella rimae ATCC 49626]KRO03062.1 inner-membrane translocator [Lancefieldella rimae]